MIDELNNLKENTLRLSEIYIQEQTNTDERLDVIIYHTVKALNESILPDGFEKELEEYLEILYLIKKDRLFEQNKNKSTTLIFVLISLLHIYMILIFFVAQVQEI